MDATSPDDTGTRDGRLDVGDVDARVLLGEIREEMFGRREPTTVGRFELRSLLGRGAHGSVYLADDPELQRLVAVKLLSSSASEPTARARLLREAQALARLKHPNVLTIHDVGVESDRVFIAMEYMEAGTLARWCTEHPPGTHLRFLEVLQLAVAAGRGLSAAHDAGIVHRDVKPANILVGDDGRPRIADFGVARAAAALTEHDLERSSDGRQPSDQQTLTRTGDILGTPAYMAPEQLAGQGDAASDQWSLCATFWEAAYGERPFAGEDLATLIEAVDGPPRAAPSERTEVPRWWRDILSRGLSRDPNARWPSVAALVSQLQHAAARRRRRVVGVAGGALALAGVGAAAVWQLDLRRRSARCEGDARAIAEVWNDEVANRLREALLGTGVSYAETSFTHAVPYLDTYVSEWRIQYTALCVAADVDGTRTPELWAASRECLGERRGELASLLDVLTQEPDATAASRTVTAVAQLRTLEPCSDDVWLARHPAAQDDPATAALRRRLRHARSLEAAGAYEDGRALAQALTEETADHASPRVRAEVRLLAGKLSDAAGAPEEARELLGEAFDDSIGAGEDYLALGAATLLVDVVGNRLVRPEQGRLWGQVAQGLKTRLGDRRDLAAARLHGVLGNVHESQGEYADAERAYASALAIRMEVQGSDHPGVAASHNNLGVVYEALARFADAESAQERALAIWQQALGSDHPDVAIAHNNLGVVYESQGRLADAERAFATALTIREQALRSDHPTIADAHDNLGNVYHSQGRYAEAQRAHERGLALSKKAFGGEHPRVAIAYHSLGNAYQAQGRHAESERAFAAALAIFEKALGPEHPRAVKTQISLGTAYYFLGRKREAEEAFIRAQRTAEDALGSEHLDVASVLNNLGELYRVDERHAEAERVYRRALAIYEKSLGPEHAHTGLALTNLAKVYSAQGRFAAAERAFERAAAIRAKALGPQSPSLAYSLHGLAKARLELDRPAAAVADAERALAILTKPDADPIDIADVQLVLARALWAARGDRARARELAREARDTYRAAGGDYTEDFGEAQTWLARHTR